MWRLASAARAPLAAQRPLGMLPSFGRALSTRPPPPNPLPGETERLPVYFPRATSHKASLEVKKRIMYSIPHMKGTWLKNLVRLHYKKGTTNSFVGALESRLDRFIWRCNLVPNVWTARHVRARGGWYVWDGWGSREWRGEQAAVCSLAERRGGWGEARGADLLC